MFSVLPASTLRPELALTGIFILIYGVIAVYAWAIPQGSRRWWGLAGLLAVLVLAGLQAGPGLARTALLDLAALSAVGLVWIQPGPQARKASRTYLALMLLSMLCAAAGLLLSGEAATPAAPLDKLAAGLLILGFGLKLAL